MGLLTWLRGIWRGDARGERRASEEMNAIGEHLRLLVGSTPPKRGSAELLKAYGESP